jgi:hypothetical protein
MRVTGVPGGSGQVNTPLQRTEAEDVARQGAGVKRVVNTIILGYPGIDASRGVRRLN